MTKDILAELTMSARRRGYPFVQPLLDEFETVRSEFASLIDRKPSEQQIQLYLEDHPVILLYAMLDGFYPVASTRSAMFPKVRLGAEFEPDFAYCSGNSMGTYWTFVELERPDVPLFNRKGDPSKYLSHAIRQVSDWKAWITDHSEYARQTFGDLLRQSPSRWDWPNQFRRDCRALIVIGRRSMLTRSTNRLRAQFCEESRFFEIITYDRLFDDYSAGKDEPLDASTDEVRLISELTD